MTVTDSALTLPTPDLLEVVASGARIDGKQVTAALLKAERQTKQQRQQISSEALLGTWRLRFTAPKKPTYRAGQPTDSGFYVPGLAIATLSFSRDDSGELTIQNQLQVGPARLRFTGPAKFLPKKNLLAFDFVRLQVLVGGLSLINLPLHSKAAKAGDFADASVARLPFFSFFAARRGYVAARGRSGGLALWAKK
ncbi:hypothetical protein ACQ4N7_17160 [Nodosilinea sp. AN01ver1]|uniref:hypothetical protein n=1 Tax=Nodosilinea sp. AN01ver1 TaxID=3423362 RepID=UPI003D31B0F2